MPQPSNNAIEAVLLRNQFYKSSYHGVMIALLVSVVVLFISIGTIVYMYTHPPTPRYFATTNDGMIMPIVPVDQPNLSQSELLQWANTAAIASYTYNYINWRKQLQELSDYFTPEGWRLFIDALYASNNLEAVKAKRLVVSAVSTGAAVLTREGILNGRYSWKVQVPLLVTYQGGRNQFTQQALTITMVISRLPSLTSMRGVAIVQLYATEQQ